MLQIIYTTSFIGAFCGYLIGISISLFLAQVKHSGPFIIGLAGFTGHFVYMITTFLLARYSNNKARNFSIFSPLIMGISYFLIFFSPVPLIFLFLALGGVATAFFWPSLQKCLSGADELKIGIYNLSWGGGVIVGSFSAGFIYSLGTSIPFYSALFLYTIAFILLISHKDKLLLTGNINNTSGEIKNSLTAETVHNIRILNYLHFVAMGSVFYLYPKLGLLREFSPQFIGIVIGIMLISRFITFFLLIDKPLILHPARTIISCVLFYISCILLGYGTHPLIALIGAILLGGTGAVSYHNSLLMHVNYGFKTEIHECIVGAGLFSGSLIAGLLGQIFNLPTAYLIIGSLIFIYGLWHSRNFISEITGRFLPVF